MIRANHAMRRQFLPLQRIACRYRGVGSPFDPELEPCTSAELATHYASKRAGVPVFVDPNERPTTASGDTVLGTPWVASVRRQRSRGVQVRATCARLLMCFSLMSLTAVRRRQPLRRDA